MNQDIAIENATERGLRYSLISGFRPHKEDYYWTTQNRCEIQVSGCTSDVLLTLKVSPFLYAGCTAQHLTISCADAVVLEEEKVQAKQTIVKCMIPVERLKQSNGKVILLLENAKSPADLGLSADIDVLGLFIQAISIVGLNVSITYIQEKITWGLEKQAQVCAMSKRLLANEDFAMKLKKVSIKRLLNLCNGLVERSDDFDKLLIQQIERDQDVSKHVKKWTDNLYRQYHALLAAVNYISNKELRNYSVSPKLEKYSSTRFDAKKISRVKKNNLALNVKEIRAGLSKINSYPPYMFISLTNICNLKCHMCYQSQIQFERFVISDDLLCKIIEYLPYNNYCSISGLGEPTLSPNYEYLASAAHHMNCYTHSISNGTLLDKKYEVLKNIKELAVSFDAAKKETFEILRSGGNFDKICANIKLIKETYPDIIISFSTTISRMNLNEISQIVELAHDLGVSIVNFNAIYNTKYLELEPEDYTVFKTQKRKAEKLGKKHGITVYMHINESHFKEEKESLPIPDLPLMIREAPKPKQARFELKKFEKCLFDTKDNAFPFDLEKDAKEDTDFLQMNWDELSIIQEHELTNYAGSDTEDELPFCLNPWNFLYVKEDGTVRLCCNSDRYMGDLKTDSIETIYNNENFQYARNSMLGKCEQYDECKTCKASVRKIGIHNFDKY